MRVWRRGGLSNQQLNTTMKRYTLIDETDRSKLGEGRNQGLGAGFAKLEKDNVLRMIHAPSSCNEYLSGDWVYTLHSGKPCSAYGLTTYKVDGVLDNDRIHFIIAVLRPNRSKEKHALFDKEYEALATNYGNMQKAMNQLEDQLKIPHTEISRIKANRYLVVAPAFWVETTWYCSLYHLVLRMCLFYQGGDVLEYLAKTKDADTYRMNSCMPKLKRLLEGKRVKQDWTTSAGGSSWHSRGILECSVL